LQKAIELASIPIAKLGQIPIMNLRCWFFKPKINIFYIQLKEKVKFFFPKSILGFRFWTFILSIFEKRIYFWEKNIQKTGSEHNDANCENYFFCM